jgi:hypothetical protein
MIKWVNEILLSFRQCFRRESTFIWFAVIVIGMMVWQEQIGVTSIVRELWINPRYYESMLHFFRSSAWKLVELQAHWLRIISESGTLYSENDMPIIVSDGKKTSKEGRKMPCVKRLHQESENSAKPSSMFGHMFGGTGVLAGNLEKLFCIPVSINIHDGDEQIQLWKDLEAVHESHVVRTIRDVSGLAKLLGKKCIVLLDRYYLSVPALLAWIEEEKKAGRPLLSIVTRVKSNATAYEKPVRKPGSGRPPLKGSVVKLWDLFTTAKDAFAEATVIMYGREEKISYLCVDLLWGRELYRELRFVLVNKAGFKPAIYACTDLEISPLAIVRLYCYRFKIECCFRELNQVVAGFAYHFWSKAMPKLNRFAPSGSDPLASVTDVNARRLITSAYHATHGFLMLACIAIGLLQMGALLFTDEINNSPLRWLRTRTNRIPSEASTADFMRKSIFIALASNTSVRVLQFIQILRFKPPQYEHADIGIAG